MDADLVAGAYRPDRLVAEDIDAYLALHQQQEPAALHHLRLGRRRQVDPDRPAALRFQGDLRGPARHARGRQPPRRHPGRRHRFRPAGRRPRRRARAGHHHRRRLPLLLHREAQVHRRRHAGPRAVHPQHGHRRLDRRPRRPPRSTPARASSCRPGAIRLHLVTLLGIKATWCWRSTRWTWSATPGDVFDAIVAEFATFAASIGLDAFTAIPISGLAGDNITTPSAMMPWYRGPTADRPSRDRADRRARGAGQAVPPAGAVGQPPQSRFPRLRRPDRRRRRAPRRPGEDVVPSGQTSRVASHRHARRRPRRGRRRPVRHSHPRRRDRLQPRRRHRRRRRPGRNRRPVRGDDRVDGRRPRSCPAEAYLLKSGARTIGATVQTLKYQVNVNTTEHLAARTLPLNEHRHRLNISLDPADRLRALRRQPRARRLHPDRPRNQRHRRRRHDPFRAAPRPEHPLAGGRRHPRAPRGR